MTTFAQAEERNLNKLTNHKSIEAPAAHTYNPSYLVCSDQEDHNITGWVCVLVVVQGEFARPHLNGEKKLSVVAYTFHPSNSGKFKIGGSWSRTAWAKNRQYLLTLQSKKGWKPGSRSRVPALHEALS
jgi:hypothetical protein